MLILLICFSIHLKIILSFTFVFGANEQTS